MSLIATIRSGTIRTKDHVVLTSRALWTRYRGLKRPWQIAIAVALAVLLIGLFMLLSGGNKGAAVNPLRTVELSTVGELSGNGSSVSVIGTVRSVSEADILAQAGGTVRRVHTRLGAQVGAGAVLAELENASERAVVLQAQGAYEAALAARSIAAIQAGNTRNSYEEEVTASRNLYRSAFTTLDTSVENYIDPMFSGVDRIEGIGVRAQQQYSLLKSALRDWRYSLDAAGGEDAETLLARAEETARLASDVLVEISRVVNASDSNATATQKAGFATARTSVDSLLASISAERDALRSSQASIQVANQQTTSTGSRVASADASVKQALGSLRLAQASLEKTIVRAPIAGTVNYLPIRVGDYVTSFQHVATVANNGSLEVVAYVSESDRELIAVGETVKVEERFEGVITAIAPALDPNTRRIEVRIAVKGGEELVNGQSVRVAFANIAAPTPERAAGPVLLPLSAVKLRTEDRIVYTVDEAGKLVAVPVETGEVRGDRIEIISALPLEVRIVVDARGLAEGQQVDVAD